MKVEGFFLVPPFFELNGLRIDTPSDNLTQTYRRDVGFFKANPHRRLMLRTADNREFDKCTETVGQWLQLPHLHVLITQLTKGTHLVSPVYRGKSFFEEVTSDGEIATIVAAMYVRGGIDSVAKAQCDSMFNASAKANNELRAQSKNEAIH